MEELRHKSTKDVFRGMGVVINHEIDGGWGGELEMKEREGYWEVGSIDELGVSVQMKS